MGKDKNAPRTKGNQKPSSSVRSAELLGGLKSNGAFLGFGAAGGFSSVSDGHRESDLTITDGFRLAFRKMAKKDSITKVKALQEFEELIKTEELSSAETALPFWPRLYCKLSLDTEKKVRECAQICHGHLAIKVGKSMAPHLKSVVPTWLLAMNDPYSAAAVAANRAFKEVFAEDKRPGVLFLCSKEIFDFILDNLFQQTADSLSDPKASTSVEREEKYIRVLCCSLESIALVQRLTKHHTSFATQMLPVLSTLLHKENFWKLHKHPNLKVRCSFFECVCEVTRSGGCDVRAASLAVRAGLSDADAAVVPHAYAALLQLADTHKECWEELGDSSRKPLSERLLRLLQEKCRGVAAEVLPLLLPLLAVMPRTALAQPQSFYMKLLKQIYGLIERSEELQSRQEATVAVKTLFECVRLFSKDSELEEGFWQQVMTELLGSAMLLSLNSGKQLDSEVVYEELVSLSNFWARNQLDQTVLDALWNTCFHHCLGVLTIKQPLQLRQILLLLQTIRNPQRHTKSKKSGVKFRECKVIDESSNKIVQEKSGVQASSQEEGSPKDTDKHSEMKDQENDLRTITVIPNPSDADLFKNQENNESSPLRRKQSMGASSKEMFISQFINSSEVIRELVTLSCRLYNQENEDLSSKLSLLNIFVELVSIFRDVRPYDQVLPEDGAGSCCHFLMDVLVPLLGYPDYAAQQLLTRLLHELLLTLSDEQQTQVLAVVLKGSTVEATRALLEHISVYHHPPSPPLTEWLSSAPLGAKLVSLLKEALAINFALAYEQQEMQIEEQQLRRKKGKKDNTGRRSNDNIDEEERGSNDDGEAMVNAKTQRGHLIALFQLVLSSQVTAADKTLTAARRLEFSANYVSQVLMVLYSSLPSELHIDNHQDTAQSIVSNVELVVQLASTVFSCSSCWLLPHSTDLLLALFLLLCPVDVLLAQPEADKDNDESTDVLVGSILPEKLITRLRLVAFGAFEQLALTAVSISGTENVNIKDELDVFLKNLLGHIKTSLYNPDCSYRGTSHLATLTSECLLIVSSAAADQDCDIPLDQQQVRDALTILLPSEGDLVEWETQMSHDYLVPTALVGSCSFRKCELPTTLQKTIGGDSYCRTAVFLGSVLLKLCGDAKQKHDDDTAPSDGVPAEDAALGEVEQLLLELEGEKSPVACEQQAHAGDEEEQVSLGPFCRLACVCVHAACYLDTVVALHDALNLRHVPAALRATAAALNVNTNALLRRLNTGNVQQISQIVRDMAGESDTGLWSVTLRRFMALWHHRVNASKLLHTLSATAFNATAVKQVLLQFVPASELLPLLDTEVVNLQSLSEDPFSGADVLAVIGGALLRCPANHSRHHVQAVMDVLLQWWKESPTIFLFAQDVDCITTRDEDISVVVKVVRVVRIVVQRHARHLTPLHWERLLCALTSWVQSMGDSTRQSVERSSSLMSLLCCVAECVAAVEAVMTALDTASPAERSEFPEKLQEEWEEFFSSFLHSVLLPLHCHLADRYCSPERRSVLLYCTCRALSEYAAAVPLRELSRHALPPLHHPKDDERTLKLPDNLQVLLNHLCAGLVSCHPVVSGTSHALLVRCLPSVMQQLNSTAAPKISEKEGALTEELALPNVLIRLIVQCGSIVSAVLEDRPVLGERVVVLPHTDSHSYVLAYCLAWHACFTALLACPDDVRPLYASELKNGDLLPLLLTMLVKLMPPQHHFPRRCRLASRDPPPSMLTTSLDLLNPQECGTSYVVWWVACQLYRQSLSLFPYWARTWYHAQSKKNSETINVFTTQHLSPLIIAEELAAIREFKSADDIVTVRVRSQREVVAVYRIDESDLELTLQLPPNLPLAPASMVHSEHSGVSSKLWEGWKSGLKTVLSYRNSPLIASLKVWKQNLDQKYQGVEPCYICYCIMQNTSHTLPGSQCRTCKKKFHSACLYQWFLSSPQSSCPLCRSVW